ncbi:MAG: hypothetical protein JXL67_13325, partial [Calditrichaeota bacterium]|nr:hypothetical protein [Calditrichota bacterium]
MDRNSTARSEISENNKIYLPVMNIIHYTTDLFEIRLERFGIEFEPGECVAIYLEDNETFREYSIASGNRDPYLSFLIKHLEHGRVTEYLQKRVPGDVIRLSHPYGEFRPGRQHKNGEFIFIATGTGIAPFQSYIRSYPGDPPLRFLYGIRRIEESVNLESIRKICPVEVAISSQNLEGYHYGRVTDLIPGFPIEPDIHYYLCGLDTMIDDVTAA